MRRKYDLAVKTSEYQDSYNKTRARWKNIGSLMEDDKGGEFILLDKFINFAMLGEPGRDNILVSLFEPKERSNSDNSSSNSSYSISSNNNSFEAMPPEMANPRQARYDAPQQSTGYDAIPF